MNNPSRTGAVLRVFLTPPVSLVLASVFAICVTGCHGKKPASGKVNSDAGATVAAAVPVSTAPVEVRKVQRRVSVVGTLHGFERITITPKVEGRVQAIHFDVGDRVVPGTSLLELDPTDYQLGQALIKPGVVAT